MTPEAIEKAESIFGHVFKDKALLKESLTHASSADNRLNSNERMEFLGDAVLDLVVCEALYLRFPEYLEGDLTKIKSAVVSRKTCAEISIETGLTDFLGPRFLMAGPSDRVVGRLEEIASWGVAGFFTSGMFGEPFAYTRAVADQVVARFR